MMAIKNMRLTVILSTLLSATAMVSPGVAEFPVNISGGVQETAEVSLGPKCGSVVVWRDKDRKSVSVWRYDNPPKEE